MFHTERFGGLYRDVTADLEAFVAHGEEDGTIPTLQAKWFRDLIIGFTTEFRRWPTYALGTPLGDYLELFENRKIHRDLRLAGHVFLHIAYDLPRVIADSFSATPTMRSDGRRVFIHPTPRFLRVFLSYARKGALGVLPRIAASFDALRVLAYWVIALRTIAWVHAEVLSDAAGRSGVEYDMAGGLFDAADEAVSHKWLLGVPELDSSELLSILPVFPTSITFESSVLGATCAAVAAAIATATAMKRQRSSDEQASATVEIFGALVLRNLSRALLPRELRGPDKIDIRTREPITPRRIRLNKRRRD